MEIKDHPIDISSDHDEHAPHHTTSIAQDPQISLTTAQSRTNTTADASYSCPDVATFISILIAFLPVMVLSSIFIPGMIIFLILLYWIASIDVFAKCDDYVDIDDAYDTNLGTYWHDLIFSMAKKTGTLIFELLVYLALFKIGPLPLRKLNFLHFPLWKWFLIVIIFLVYFGLWCLTRLLLHRARECTSSDKVFLRVYMFPIYEGLLGEAIWGFYFLVEFLVFKIIAPSMQTKTLNVDAHILIHTIVYLFIGINVGRILSASFVALFQMKYQHHGKLFYAPNKEGNGIARKELNRTQKYMGVCRHVKDLLLIKNYDEKNCAIYVVIGLRRSIIVVLISIWSLIHWNYNLVGLGQSPHAVVREVIYVGTVTLSCLLIFSILWLMKTCIMLWWKYRSMYHKFYKEVLEAGTKLYLLSMIFGQQQDVLRVGWSGNKNNIRNENAEKKRIYRVVAKARTILVHDVTSIDVDRRKGDQPQLMKNPQYQPGIYAIMRMVKYFLRAEYEFKKDINEMIQKHTKKWRQAHRPYDQTSSKVLSQDDITKAYGSEKLHKDDFDMLRRQMEEEVGEGHVKLRDFEIWMKMSYTKCYNMANTLASAKQLSDYLNRAMVVINIPTIIGIWLVMYTKNTKTVTILTAPILAVSFVFQETISTVFKGIIFSYAIHPYDIGDYCIIENTKYEVKRIDFWRTTFLKLETNEIVAYPNSALFDKSIINKSRENGGLDAKDHLQFTFESNSDKRKIVELTDRIDEHFSREQSTKKQQVEVSYDIRGARKQINLNIKFRHNVEDPGLLNSELLRKKISNKKELEDHIMKLCNQYGLQVVAHDNEEKEDNS